jgi:ubiquinone/menaquinone biosynthesis C-methylase UbiE
LENAKVEKVEGRIAIQTGDIRSLPYPDKTFDAIISSLVIHNIPDEKGRERALSEMLRVLKPGGRFALFDIHYGKKYARFLSGDKTDSSSLETIASYCPPAYIIKGNMRNP